MMMKDTRYIIKRIIIGVAIALIVFLIKKNVYAKDIASVYNPFSSSNTEVVSNVNTYANFYISGNPWANRGIGYVRFNFSLIKVSGASTDPVVVPTGVYANDYVCDVASTSTNNSTWTGNTYSAVCPVKMDSNGLTKIAIDLAANQQNSQSLYRITISPLISFETYDGPTSMSDTNTAINNQTTAINNQTTAITNNQNTNTQSIINNQNQNTQDIINNQNQNTQQQIESMQVCSIIDKNDIVLNDRYLTSSGAILNQSYSIGWGITDYINVQGAKIEKLSTLGTGPSLCFYNINKDLISCSQNASVSIGNITFPNDTSFVRFSIEKTNNKPQYKLCTNGNQAIVNSNKELQNTITDTDTDTAQQDFDSWFSDFDVDTHGVTQIVTAPLRLLQALLDSECSQFSIPLPFVDNDVTLPCMTTIYQTHFGDFFTLYKFITDGVIAYWVAVNTFRKIQSFLDPTDDKVEVFNL